MRRRDLILGAGAMGLAAPAKTKLPTKKQFKWKMVTTWPPQFPRPWDRGYENGKKH